MTASEKLLESTVVREILGAVNPAPAGTAPSANPQQAHEEIPALAVPTILPDGKLSSAGLLDRVSDTVINRAGRDFTRNDIANLMICLTQGYITTFAGMPARARRASREYSPEPLALRNPRQTASARSRSSADGPATRTLSVSTIPLWSVWSLQTPLLTRHLSSSMSSNSSKASPLSPISCS